MTHPQFTSLPLTKAELATVRDAIGHALGLPVELPPEHLLWPLHTAFAEAVQAAELNERFLADQAEWEQG